MAPQLKCPFLIVGHYFWYAKEVNNYVCSTQVDESIQKSTSGTSVDGKGAHESTFPTTKDAEFQTQRSQVQTYKTETGSQVQIISKNEFSPETGIITFANVC